MDAQTAHFDENDNDNSTYIIASMRWRARFQLADVLGVTTDAVDVLHDATAVLLPFYADMVPLRNLTVATDTYPPDVVLALLFHVPKDADGGAVDALLRNLTDTAQALCSACMALDRVVDAELHAAAATSYAFEALALAEIAVAHDTEDTDAAALREEERSYPAFHALCASAQLYLRQDRLDEAAERYLAAVELATRFHGTVNALAQEALECLASTYLQAGDYGATARWARTSYNALADFTESSADTDDHDLDRALGRAAFLLAEASWRSGGDAVGVEDGVVFARQALAAHARAAPSSKDLAGVAHLRCLSEVLQLGGDLGEEPKRLLERALDVLSWHRSRGGVAIDKSMSLVTILDALARFHERRSHRLGDTMLRAEAVKVSRLYYEQALVARK